MKTAGQDLRHGQHTPTPEGGSTIFALPTASVSFCTDIQKKSQISCLGQQNKKISFRMWVWGYSVLVLSNKTLNKTKMCLIMWVLGYSVTAFI